MSERDRSAQTAPRFNPEDLRIATDDGALAVKFPSGQVLRIQPFVHVEDRLERPFMGRQIDLNVEVDCDDHAWWQVYPDSDDRRFPEVVLDPEVIEPEDRE